MGWSHRASYQGLAPRSCILPSIIRQDTGYVMLCTWRTRGMTGRLDAKEVTWIRRRFVPLPSAAKVCRAPCIRETAISEPELRMTARRLVTQEVMPKPETGRK
jgi:hypothetical protein